MISITRQFHSLFYFFNYSFFSLTLILSLSANASDANNNFALVKVEQGIYAHLGLHESIESKQRDNIANIGFIIGDDCIAVIDTGGSVKIGEQLRASIRTISEKPVCYVINTHIHYDHILGNHAFVADKPVFVGHQQLPDAIEQNRNFFLEQFKAELGNSAENAIIGPSLLVEQSTEIDLGNRILTLKAFPVSHSHNDLIVIDNNTRTLWSGHLIFRERVPSLTGSLRGWIKTMNAIADLDIKKVVPGHGTIANSLEGAMLQQHQYLTKVLDETRKAIAEGQFLNDAVENIDKDNQGNWLLHEYQHPTNVSRAFTELEWE